SDRARRLIRGATSRRSSQERHNRHVPRSILTACPQWIARPVGLSPCLNEYTAYCHPPTPPAPAWEELFDEFRYPSKAIFRRKRSEGFPRISRVSWCCSYFTSRVAIFKLATAICISLTVIHNKEK